MGVGEGSPMSALVSSIICLLLETRASTSEECVENVGCTYPKVRIRQASLPDKSSAKKDYRRRKKQERESFCGKRLSFLRFSSEC
jgi:hypothetical protein